jgi:sodium/potassium/calcium exchanger 6
LVLTLTLPVVDDGNQEGGIALPESEEEPFNTDLELGPDEADVEDDGLLRPDIGEGLHHLVEGGFSPLHSPLGRIYHSSRRANEDEGEDDDVREQENDKEMQEELEREEALNFNKSLTAAQCIFGPTFCAYVIFSKSSSYLLVWLEYLTSR